MGGEGRPIEQVVVVGNDELLYDPCFIASSEDADMTAGVNYEISLGWSEDPDKLVRKSDAPIDKVEFAADGNFTTAYMDLRTRYLKSLAHEDAIVVEYNKDKETKLVTVGALAREIADLHHLDQLLIRSLIIEKILLAYKAAYLYQ
jgi:hypothetical protein